MMRRKVENTIKNITLDKLGKATDGKRKALYEMLIYKGLPVVCKDNVKKLDICNNERFVVTDFNQKKKKIMIKNDVDVIIELSY